MKRRWTPDEENRLLQCLNNKESIKNIADKLNRTESSVLNRIYKLGKNNSAIKVRWTPEEIEKFKEDWHNPRYTIAGLCKKYNRTEQAIRCEVFKLGLGNRGLGRTQITITELANELNINRNIIVRWTKKFGLNVHKNNLGLQKYTIDIDELLIWFEKNQHRFDASKMSTSLFYDEPNWLKDKRKEDKKNNDNRYINKTWTKQDVETLKSMLTLNKSYDEIAKKLNRTVVSIQRYINIHHLVQYKKSNKPWTEDEVQILIDNYHLKEMYQLEKLLPYRSKHSINSKIQWLKRKNFL